MPTGTDDNATGYRTWAIGDLFRFKTPVELYDDGRMVSGAKVGYPYVCLGIHTYRPVFMLPPVDEIAILGPGYRVFYVSPASYALISVESSLREAEG